MAGTCRSGGWARSVARWRARPDGPARSSRRAPRWCRSPPTGRPPRPGAPAKERAVEATLRSLDSVLAEPLEECLWRDSDGVPCLEARSPPELEAELGLPGGYIFDRDLSWPFAERDEDVGTWGVETAYP